MPRPHVIAFLPTENGLIEDSNDKNDIFIKRAKLHAKQQDKRPVQAITHPASPGGTCSRFTKPSITAIACRGSAHLGT
jgi:hypothetical protein